MRFEKGSKVEVLSRKDGSFGVWRSAEILSGDQHSFSVMYDYPPNHNNQDRVAKVSSNAIRPCPPPMDNLSHCWSPGDLVEVFQDFSWKTAAILKVLGPNHFMIKLIGYSRELLLRKVHIRVRQFWQDGEWILIGKGKTNKFIPSAENRLTVENKTGLQHSVIQWKGLKRASPFRASNGKASKIRVKEEKGDCREVMPCSASFLTKVDAVGESDTDGCSVASCSVIKYKPVCCPHPLVGNDAESIIVGRDEDAKRYPSMYVNAAVSIHSLELQAYRGTMEILYASGPLNWEQEVMLTNLRRSLNISKVEHLLELRKLISSGSRLEAN